MRELSKEQIRIMDILTEIRMEKDDIIGTMIVLDAHNKTEEYLTWITKQNMNLTPQEAIRKAWQLGGLID